MKRTFTLAAGILCLGLAAWAQTPSITAVQDAGSYTANIAQGSVFVVKGTNLSSATLNNGFSQAALPLPTSIPGTSVKITFTPVGGGTATDAYMVYTYNVGGVNQLAAVLPSSVAAGDYNVTVTNGTAVSAAFRTTVVKRKFQIIAADGSGTGLAVIQNFISSSQYDLNRYTSGTVGGFTYSPAHPGQVVVIWGTGLGAVTSPDNNAPGSVDFRSQAAVRVLVNGVSITPDLYAGRAPSLPGTDEIILTLPPNTSLGCTVSLQVSVDGALSNAVSMSTAAAGTDACNSTAYTKDTLAKLDQGGALTVGNFALLQFQTSIANPLGSGTLTAKVESASGFFTRITGAQLSNNTNLTDTSGVCQVVHRTGPDQTSLLVPASAANLDAGANLTLTGPGGLNKAVPRLTGNVYNLALNTAISGLTLPPGITLPPGLGISTTPLLVAGNYALTGTGGADVRAFTATVTIGNPLTVNGGLPAAVTRSAGLNLTWTGGNPTDVVEIIGFAGTNTGTTAAPFLDTTLFICGTNAGKGSFTIPASVLNQLPAITAAQISSGTGVSALGVLSSTSPVADNGVFKATLVSGTLIDSGLFLGTVGILNTPAYQ